jgi:hypothetical protein
MKYSATLTFLVLLTITACTMSDDNNTDNGNNELTVSDLTLSMTENPENGDSIGTIEGASNNGPLTFSILSQTSNGSIEVNATTGELLVADKTKFEYQIYPIISAIIQVSDSINTENALLTINLTERTKVYIGDIILETQEDVNNFGSERYTEISGFVIIGGQEGEDITDLSPLFGLNYIKNYLGISFNEHLTNLDGLESLIDIRIYIQINHNNSLSNINGLKNLNNIGDSNYLSSGGISFIFNSELQNIDGLLGLTKVSSNVDILNNQSLKNIDGLSNIERIQNLVIINNDLITNINGLSNTTFIENEITIKRNDSLNDFCGLRPFFSNNDFIGNYDVELNEYNPSQVQINNGACSLL